jgi:ankyrin repeat protein
MLQVQNPNGLFSNDFIFHVTADRESATAAEKKIRRDRVPSRLGLWDAIAENDLKKVRDVIRRGANVSARDPESGSTPLGQAALLGNVEIGKFLIQKGARVSGSNRDGNTPLHIAAFLCDFEFVQILLEQGADRNKKNGDGRVPVDVISSDWNKRTAEFYKGIGKSTGREFALDKIQENRPKMAKLLRDYGETAEPND